MQKRPLRPFEQGAHLHVLDWAHQTARYRFQTAGAVQVKAAAKASVRASAVDAPVDAVLQLPSLVAAVHAELRKLYALGHATVRSELDHQAHGHALPVGLSAETFEPVLLAVADTADPASLLARAQLAAQSVAHAVWQAVHRGRLQGISSKRALRGLGERAGNGALSSAASNHAGGAISAGRRAAATGRRAQIIGARYTSVLDKNTCGPCADADTGELLALDSPEWVQTPNPACLGGDRCRCIHVYQLATETQQQAIAAGR